MIVDLRRQQTTELSPAAESIRPFRHGQQRYCPVENGPTSHALVYQKWNYPIVRCRQCGLVSTALSESDTSELDHFYEADYFEGGRRDGYGNYAECEPSVRKHFAHVVQLAEKHAVGRRLLDIGCAYGFLLKEAANHFRATGIDVSRHCTDVARSQGLDVRHGGLQEQRFAEKSFDVVTLLDCIEHLPAPRQTLEESHRLLAPRGIAIITTGDIEQLYSRVAGRYWRLMTPPQHTHYFSRRTLTALLDSVGFEVLSCRYFWKYVPLSLVAYQLASRLRLPAAWTRKISGGVYINLGDVMTIVARKKRVV